MRDHNLALASSPTPTPLHVPLGYPHLPLPYWFTYIYDVLQDVVIPSVDSVLNEISREFQYIHCLLHHCLLRHTH